VQFTKHESKINTCQIKKLGHQSLTQLEPSLRQRFYSIRISSKVQNMKRFFLLFLLLSLIGCQNKNSYGPYSIGRDKTWFPLEIGLQGPNLNGFTDTLIQEISNTEDIPMQITNIDWIQLFEALEKNEVAGIFSSLPPNIISQEKYSFSNPFLLLGPVLVVRNDSNATSLSDLEGKIVSVNQFDDSVLIAQKYPSIMIQIYQSKPLVLQSLKNDEIDGVLMPSLDAHALVPHLYPNQLKIVTPPLNNKALRVITLKGSHPSLIEKFNIGLDKAYTSGKYDELRKTFKLN